MTRRKDMARCGVILILFFLVMAVNDLKAQAGLQVKYLNIDDGLSQGEVTAILQDRMGFMWFATRGGLNRYDGYHFKVFKHNPRNENSLPNSSIEAMFEDSNGDIWIGTKAGGLSRFIYAKERFINYRHIPGDSTSISEKRVVSIAEDHDGNMWFGTFNKGLNRYIKETNSFKRYFPQHRVSEIFVSSHGQVWISVAGGLSRYDKETDSFRSINLPYSFIEVVDIIEDKDSGLFYLCTWEKGVLVLDPSSGKISEIRKEGQDNFSKNAYRILQDDSGAIWIGNWGYGLYLLNNKENKLDKADIMPPNVGGLNVDYDIILSLFEDKNGSIWVGTDGGGICKIDKKMPRFNTLAYQGNSGLSSNHIISVFADSKNNLWIGTRGGGLNVWSGDNDAPVMRLNLPEKLIKAIYEDKQGNIWIGSEYGLHKVKRLSGVLLETEMYKHQAGNSNSLSGRKVTAIFEDRNSNFWVGTQQNGLNRLINYDQHGNPRFKRYLSDQGDMNALGDNRVSYIYEDHKGRLWIASYGGLHLYKEETDNFIRYENVAGDPNSISSNIITCILAVEDTIWVGTPNGLNKGTWNDEGELTFSTFNKEDGLPDDYIHAVLYDDKYKIWISTNGGISCYDFVKNEFKNYNYSDGLPGNAFSEGACVKKDGMMYFGGLNGLVFFHPDSIFDNEFIPEVAITDFKIFNKTVEIDQVINGRQILSDAIPLTRSIILSHKENVFTIEFASLDYTAPEKNNYAYQLEGFDKEWTFVGNNRTVTYTNLREGDYQFKVKGSNSSNIWNEKPSTLNIKILPPPWKTWWAYLIYIVAAFGLMTMIRWLAIKQTLLNNNLRLAQLERDKEHELNEAKSRFFTNVSHEFRTPLTLILAPLEEMLANKKMEGTLKEQVGLLHQHANRLLHLVNQLLDFRKAEAGKIRLQAAEGNIVKFLKEVFISFKEQARIKGINFKFSSEGDLNLYFDRDKMEIVISNLLSNAFKYTPTNGSVEVCVKRNSQFQTDFCEINVKDNGTGISAEAKDKIFDRFYQITNADSANLIGSGIGLSLTKDYVEAHKGSITVESEFGKGCEFIIRLPLGKNHLSAEQIIENFVNSENPAHYEVGLVCEHIEDKGLEEVDKNQEKNAAVILVVEDNAEVLHYICSFLLRKGYHIMTALNGKEGLEMAKEHLPDLIISDLMMPEMDGLELCNCIKNNEKTADIPIIILTARTSSIFKVDGFHSGVDDYITKPFNPETLSARVSNLIRSRKKLKDSYSRKVKLEPTDVEVTPYDEKMLKKAVELIEKNLQNSSFSTQLLAEELNMSGSTLYRKLKTLTGSSVNEFIRTVRLKRAAQLLSTGEYTVSEAAYEVGIYDMKYFRNCFKKQYGVSPSLYQIEGELEK